MAIKWKKGKKFNPEVVLHRLNKAREVKDDGASFAGFSLNTEAATLYSMLDFPDAASGVDKPGLVWSALFTARPELTPDSFMEAINASLKKHFDKKEENYVLATGLSIDCQGLPKTMSIMGCSIHFFGYSFPKILSSRAGLILRHSSHLKIQDSSGKYCAVGVFIKAKTKNSATTKALRALDIFRGLMCLEGNMGMQFDLGDQKFEPINVVRLGAYQTLHKVTGEPALDGVWYEPNYRQEKLFKFKNLSLVLKNVRYALRRIRLSRFGGDIAESLLRYVRALDEPDPNVAFLKLWGAFESLLTPGRAVYDDLVDRCCFLYADSEYHRQVLMSLREYRNESVHAGQEARQAKTNCYLLQGYYRHVFWYLVARSLEFKSLSEVHEYLSLPNDLEELKRRRALYARGIRFLSPLPSD